jgi:DNA-directed RNA polymerase specialized sigma24 family protein
MAGSRERAVEILRGPDGERLWLALVDYAHKLARRYGWTSDKTLPQGSSPREVAEDVMIKILEGDRVWDETKEPFMLNALKGMVRSEMGHLFDDYEASHVERIERTLPDGKERTVEMFPGTDPSPADQLLRAEQTRLEMTALDLIREEVEGNADLESVFLALYESSSSQEIAKTTQLPIERVYSLCRELDRKASKITPARVAREALERRKNG